MTKSGGERGTAVEAIYRAASSPETWPDALDAIAACYDAVGTVLLMKRASGEAIMIVSPVLLPAAQDYEGGAWQLDFMMPRAIEAAHLNTSSCYTDRDLATPEEIAKHPFYNDFRARHGRGPYLGALVSPCPNVPVILTMQGSREQAPFSEADVASYARLARHVERSLTLSIRLSEVEAERGALSEALDRMRCGAFLLDQTGRVTYVNHAGREMIGRLLRIEVDHLVASGKARAGLSTAIADALVSPDFGAATPVLLSDEHDRPAAVVHVLPMPRSSNGLGALTSEVRAIALAIPLGTSTPADPAVLRDLLGLTLGEARLASLVGSGRTPREASQALGITEASARTVLKRVFEKAGVSRQVDLANLVGRIAMVKC